MKVTAKIQRQLNDEFLLHQNQLGATAWKKAISKANQDIAKLDKLPTKKQIKEIVSNALAEAFKNYIVQITRVGLLLGAITLNIKGTKDEVQPAKMIATHINITRPKSFIRQLFNLDGRIQRGLGGTTVVNSRVLMNMERFYEISNDRIQKIATKNLKLYDKVNKKTQKAMVNNYLKATRLASKEATIPAQVKKLAETLTSTSIANVKMIVATEGNALLQSSQLDYNKALGLTYKRWIQNVRPTQRVTQYHTTVVNKKVKIDDKFKAAGMSADHPCDDSLPIGERANCKCYLEFE